MRIEHTTHVVKSIDILKDEFDTAKPNASQCFPNLIPPHKNWYTFRMFRSLLLEKGVWGIMWAATSIPKDEEETRSGAQLAHYRLVSFLQNRVCGRITAWTCTSACFPFLRQPMLRMVVRTGAHIRPALFTNSFPWNIYYCYGKDQKRKRKTRIKVSLFPLS